jgi:heterodisulfide reductase subunit A-like polyferredoxin
MMNLHGVKPGNRILMVGSGNVGLVVSYQLLQAGCEVVALVDAASRIGGYGVHAAKLARNGVPFYLSHTVVRAHGTDCVSGVTIAEVDRSWKIIPGTEKYFDVDLICMAVGLNPMSQLARMAGAKMIDRGGQVPEVNEFGETSVSGVFAAGDVAGIEEASSAMINGRIAGLAAARKSGFIENEVFKEKYRKERQELTALRKGTFSPENRGRTDLKYTDEGICLSQSLFTRGYLEDDEITSFPGVTRKTAVHPVIECTQNIPCDPCQKACAFGCIKMSEDITSLPFVDPDADCRDCGKCVAACSGQAIFLVNEVYDDMHASITIPYEFDPLPEEGEKGVALGRNGARLGEAEIIRVRTSKAYDHTALVTMKVAREIAMDARAYKRI